MPFVANTPKPPYYVVVFTSINAPGVDHTEHGAMSHRLVEIAETYDGYLGIEPARTAMDPVSRPFISGISRRLPLLPAIRCTWSRSGRGAKPGTRTT
jgi:hypothetical protein